MNSRRCILNPHGDGEFLVMIILKLLRRSLAAGSWSVFLVSARCASPSMTAACGADFDLHQHVARPSETGGCDKSPSGSYFARLFDRYAELSTIPASRAIEELSILDTLLN
jgi:hypothetical protein